MIRGFKGFNRGGECGERQTETQLVILKLYMGLDPLSWRLEFP